MSDEKPFSLSVKGLVRDGQGRCLVIRRSRESAFWPGAWDFVGGKLDAGETFDRALVREAMEEAGLEIRLLRYLGGIEWPLPRVKVVFIIMEANVTGGEFKLSDEHEEFMWVSIEELRGLELCEPIARILQGCPELSGRYADQVKESGHGN